MTRTVTALFDSFDDAAQAVRDLDAAAILFSEISLISKAGENPAGPALGNMEEAAEGAGKGAAVGAAIGGGTGLLAGLGLIAIPGLGPAIAAGWLAATGIAAMIGAATGGIIGALAGAGLSDEEAQFYAEALRRGGTLVVVRVDDTKYDTVRAIFSRNKAVDTKARIDLYRESDWTGFDKKAGSNPVDEQPRARRRIIS